MLRHGRGGHLRENSPVMFPEKRALGRKAMLPVEAMMRICRPGPAGTTNAGSPHLPQAKIRDADFGVALPAIF